MAARLHPESLGELERSPDQTLPKPKGRGWKEGREGRRSEGKGKGNERGRERVKRDLPAPTEGDRRPL